MINNDNFIVKEIPTFHAISQKYDRTAFWKSEKRKCLEGMWFGGKWCPGILYFFVNYFTIRFEIEDGSAGRKVGRPFFRDIEWERAYIVEEADGFSGFSGDTLYTCDRKYGPEKDKALKFGWITEDELKSKIYIPAREYMRKIHPTNLGRPLYRNSAKNILQLTSRGTGKSYFAACQILHNFLFDGSTNYDAYLESKNTQSPLNSDTVVGAIESKYSDDLLKKVKVAMEMLPDRQVINNEVYPSPLWVNSSGSLSSGKALVSTTGSVINVRSFSEDPLAANGTRPNKAFLEECFAKGTHVRMANLSIKNIEDIIVGDAILGIDGNPKYVSKTTTGISNMYKINQKRGIDYIVSGNHLLYLEQRSKVGLKDDGIKLIAAKDFNTDELGKYRIRTTYGKKSGLINFNNNKELKLDPYYLGIWLGDGISAGQGVVVNITRDYEINEYLKELCIRLDLSYNFRKATTIENDNVIIVCPTKKIGSGKTNLLRQDLQYYNLINNKHIPKDYLTSSELDRLELLAGIIDTDGSLGYNTTKTSHSYEICVHDRNELKNNIVFLANSLGFDVSVCSSISTKGYNKKPIPPIMKYRILIKGEIWRIPVKVKRKKQNKWIKTNAVNSSPISVENIGIGKYYGFTLIGTSDIDHLFMLEDNTIVHNCGFMNNFIEVIGAIESTQASSDYKNLVIHALGTGGLSVHGAVIYTKEVFYNPEEFNFLSFDDIWENKGKIGFFIPGTQGINKFKKGPNFITDEVNAKLYIEEEINKAKASGNRRRYMAEIINKPLKPSDIFLTVEGNFFPIDDIREHLASIENNKRILEASWKVEFYIKDGKVEWNVSNKPVLREFPHRRGDTLDTAIEIWELPKTDSSGKPPYGRYLASLDPVDNDGGDDTEHSLLSGFILDSWTDRIVVEYSGRTKLVDEFYEQWRRCLVFYNAICNYERNLKGFYPHMKKNTSLHYLCDQPEILSEKGLATRNGAAVGNQIKGTHCTIPIINWGLELLLTYINNKAYEQGDIVQDENTDEAIYIRNLSTIRSPAVLQEMLAYNSEVNVDRISSLILLMILREDRIMLSKNAFNKKVEVVTTNKFWDKAYKRSPNHYFNPYGNKN
jgi:hypothetical protein